MMSCRRRTTVLRIPASALGFLYRRQWDEFLNEHEDDFDWEPGFFGESLSDNFPMIIPWESADFHDPNRLLNERHPNYPDIVPGPFLDYCLEEILPLQPEDCHYGNSDKVRPLKKSEAEQYLPLYRELFPHFTMKDMEAVLFCEYEWYDGSNAPYLYSSYE